MIFEFTFSVFFSIYFLFYFDIFHLIERAKKKTRRAWGQAAWEKIFFRARDPQALLSDARFNEIEMNCMPLNTFTECSVDLSQDKRRANGLGVTRKSFLKFFFVPWNKKIA